MAEDHSRSPTTDLSTLLGMRTKSLTIFDISKAYKFLGRKWQGNHHNRKKNSLNDKDEALNGGGKKDNSNRKTSSDDDDESTSEGSLLLSRDKKTSEDKFLFCRSFLTRSSSSRRSHMPTLSSMLSRSTSRDENQSRGRFGVLFRNKSSRRSVSMSRQSTYVDEGRPASIKRSVSSTRGSMNASPIVFSQTATRRKTPPIEKKIECTLEELCFGSVKYVIIKRDVLSETGVIQEEESLKINIKPGLKKGTKITFEGKGDEKPGHLPSDIVFLIEERRHPLFKRRGDDLEIGVEIPLVQALMGCTLSVPLLGGEKMNLYVDKVICPGYEKEISGKGMLNPNGNGKRGELRIAFFVKFPSELSGERRSEICTILDQVSHENAIPLIFRQTRSLTIFF